MTSFLLGRREKRKEKKMNTCVQYIWTLDISIYIPAWEYDSWTWMPNVQCLCSCFMGLGLGLRFGKTANSITETGGLNSVKHFSFFMWLGYINSN